jgi:hypothetical protein
MEPQRILELLKELAASDVCIEIDFEKNGPIRRTQPEIKAELQLKYNIKPVDAHPASMAAHTVEEALEWLKNNGKI